MTNLSLRQPPHNIDAEKALLGAIFAYNHAHERVAEFLRPEHFALTHHGHIFAAATALIDRGQVADPVTLKLFFEQDETLAEIGGPEYLSELANSATTAINAGEYGRIILDNHERRELIGLGEDLLARAYSGDTTETVLEIRENHEQALFRLAEAGHTESGPQPFSHFADKAIKQMDAARVGGTPGVSTGFIDLDDKLGGLHPSDLIILAGRPSMGKAQKLDSVVLRADGAWSDIGNLQLGDQLASVDGAASRVTGVYPRGMRQLFKITFSDGRSTEACSEHLWRIYHRDWDAPRIVSTSDLGGMLEAKRNRGRIWIDLQSGHFGRLDALPLDPYLLGAFIANGNCSGGTARISTPDAQTIGEIVQLLDDEEAIRVAGSYDFRISKRCRGKSRTPFVRALEDLGLWGLGSPQRFIPPAYFCADRQARLSLLQGLIDTDGWVEKKGSVRYSTSSKTLATDVQRIVRSLGGLCRIATKTAPTYHHNGEQRTGLEHYVCCIRHHDPATLMRLYRKRTRATRTKDVPRLTVSSIEPTQVSETVCIAVSHPSNLYITDQYVVTHNSALAGNIARNAANAGVGVGFFSLEMSGDQLAGRALAGQCGVGPNRLRTGKLNTLDAANLHQAAEDSRDLPLFIDESPALTVAALRTRVRRLKRRHDIGLVIIDYLQLMVGRAESKQVEISDISRGLKAIAKETGLPVLALSQLSRKLEDRPDKRPVLSDLRESGAIEQDADVVMFIYRPAYYLGPEAPKVRADEGENKYANRLLKWEAAQGVAEVNIAKHRHGPTGMVKLYFDTGTVRFGTLDRRAA